MAESPGSYHGQFRSSRVALGKNIDKPYPVCFPTPNPAETNQIAARIPLAPLR